MSIGRSANGIWPCKGRQSFYFKADRSIELSDFIMVNDGHPCVRVIQAPLFLCSQDLSALPMMVGCLTQ